MKDKLNLEKIVSEYAERAGTNTQGAIRDIITDCMHLASSKGLDFQRILFGADEVFHEEGGRPHPHRNIIYSFADDNQHRIRVENSGIDGDCLMFVFTDEGLVIDTVTGGMVGGTSSQTYGEIEDGLG